MTDVITAPAPHTSPEGRLATEQEARDVAEAAREKEWQAPSFVRQLFEGSFLLHLVHPFPEIDPAEEARARPVHGAARTVHAGGGRQRSDRPRGSDPA